MLLTLAGALITVLGLASALVLLASPLGLAPAAPGIVTWLLFPLFTVIGTLMLVMGSRGAGGTRPARWVAGALLALALLAAVALFANATGLASAQGTAALWYVLVLAGMAGGLGTAAFSRRADADA